jgi:predicted MFS family arabinose efflux permease
VGRPAGDLEAVAWKLPNLDLPGLTGLEALRSVRFWCLAFSFFILSGTTGGVISHLVPLLGDRGLSPETATGMMGIAGIALIAGRLLAGLLVDRIHAPYVALVFFLAPLVGIAVLLSTPGSERAGIGTALVGLGVGAEVDLIAYLLSRYLGMRSFGEIYGYFFSIFMLGAGLGPLAMGVSYDRTGSYKLILLCFTVALALASPPMLRLGAYAYPSLPEAVRDNVLAH